MLQLRTKLEQKFGADERIVDVLNGLRHQGWLNDELFAHNYVREKVQQGWGPQKIQACLSEALGYHEGIEALLEQIDWRRQLQSLLASRMSRMHPQGTSAAMLARLMRFAKTRGFTDEQIRDSLAQCMEQASSTRQAFEEALDLSGESYEA